MIAKVFYYHFKKTVLWDGTQIKLLQLAYSWSTFSSPCLVFEGAVFLDTTQVVVPPTSKNVRESEILVFYQTYHYNLTAQSHPKTSHN